MTKDNYEVLVDTAIQSATVLDHSKSPCEENFIPDTQVGTRKTSFFVSISRYKVHVIMFPPSLSARNLNSLNLNYDMQFSGQNVRYIY